MQWRTLLARLNGDTVLPFLIGDVTPRSLRVPGDAAARHPLGATRLTGLTVVVADLSACARALSDLLGRTGQAIDLPEAGSAVQFDLGAQWIVLAQPADADSALGRYVETWGQGPYEVVLTTGADAAPGTGALLPPARLHGARFRIVR